MKSKKGMILPELIGGLILGAFIVIVFITIGMTFFAILLTISYHNNPKCSNEKYSTEYIDDSILDIHLSFESQQLLVKAINSQGDIALQGISDLTCLEYFDLEYSRWRKIQAYAPSKISNISALKSLTNLKWLNLSKTNVSDLSPLRHMKKLETLKLENVTISDYSQLQGLNLRWLYISGNNFEITCENLKKYLPTTTILAWNNTGAGYSEC